MHPLTSHFVHLLPPSVAFPNAPGAHRSHLSPAVRNLQSPHRPTPPGQSALPWQPQSKEQSAPVQPREQEQTKSKKGIKPFDINISSWRELRP